MGRLVAIIQVDSLFVRAFIRETGTGPWPNHRKETFIIPPTTMNNLFSYIVVCRRVGQRVLIININSELR